MNKTKAPKLVTVAIFTTVTLIFWVFFSLYNILISTPIVTVDAEILEPLDPQLNITVLDSIPQKVFIEEGDINLTPAPTVETENLIPPEENPDISTSEEENNEALPTEGV